MTLFALWLEVNTKGGELMPERLIATMHKKDADGNWRKVAEQDVTDFSIFRMAEFYDLQNDQGRVVIAKREGVKPQC